MKFFVHYYEPGFGWGRSMSSYDGDRAMLLARTYSHLGFLKIRLTNRGSLPYA